jgi:elongation factor P
MFAPAWSAIMKASELKRGNVVSIDGGVYMVREVQVQSPSSRSGNTLYKVQYRHVVTRQKLEHTYRGDDAVPEATFERRPVQLLFREPEACTFMDLEDYQQYTLDSGAIAAELPYLVDALEGVHALVSEGVVLGLELPATVELEVIECAPGMKGASAAARSKPATLSTGLVVQVPEYISPGDRVRVNTETGEYMARA